MRQRYCDSMQFSANSHSGHRSLVLPFLTPAGRALSIGPGQREVARRHAKYRCRIAGVEIDHRAPDIGCGAAIIRHEGVLAGAADQDNPALTIRRKGPPVQTFFPQTAYPRAAYPPALYPPALYPPAKTGQDIPVSRLGTRQTPDISLHLDIQYYIIIITITYL